MLELKRDFFMLLAFRISSVFLIKTAFVPDEYWQSVEVAHNIVFGYGYLTWEWKLGIRSYLHPLVFASLFKILDILKLDYPFIVVILPRIFQAILSAISDYYFLLWCRHLGADIFWTRLVIFTNWFWYYCASRTLINTFETCLTVTALYYFPWSVVDAPVKKTLKHTSHTTCYLLLAAINCVMRPTAVILWAPLAFWHLFMYNKKYELLKKMFLVGVMTIVISILLDSVFYGKWIIPQLKFFEVNVMKGISSFYGVHPWHWYLLQGLPVVLGLQYFPFLVQAFLLIFSFGKKTNQMQFGRTHIVLLIIIIVNLLAFSLIPHKEFRFVLPLVPMMSFLGIKYMSQSGSFYTQWDIFRRFWILLSIFIFIIATFYFGIFHQRESLEVIEYLSREVGKHVGKMSILFLVPCHSLPLYSHLHSNISSTILTCEPFLTEPLFTEQNGFREDASGWLARYWTSHQESLPSHVVIYYPWAADINDFLVKKDFLKQKYFVAKSLHEESSAVYVVYEGPG